MMSDVDAMASVLTLCYALVQTPMNSTSERVLYMRAALYQKEFLGSTV